MEKNSFIYVKGILQMTNIERTKTSQKALRLETVPAKDLLAKSQDQTPKTERRELVRNEALKYRLSNK